MRILKLSEVKAIKTWLRKEKLSERERVALYNVVEKAKQVKELEQELNLLKFFVFKVRERAYYGEKLKPKKLEELVRNER